MRPGQHPGVDTCPDCGQRVLYAVNLGGLMLALDPDESGDFAAWEDAGVARFRRVPPGGQLVLGERLFCRHDAACSALATVTDLTAERTRRLRQRPPGSCEEDRSCPLTFPPTPSWLTSSTPSDAR
jgi:hypothetical protein